MQTITIRGRELPLDGLETCPDFDIQKGKLLFGACLEEWNALYTWQKRHAACVAARWFERLSKTVYPFAKDEYGHTIPNPKRDEYKAAADAWGELADELWEV